MLCEPNPIWLLHISALLSRHETKVKIQIVEISLLARHITLVSLFHYHPRVLDAWVSRYLATARENFVNKQSVADRQVYVPMPITINEALSENQGAAAFQPIFNKRKVTVLIAGADTRHA
jgi:hypothetical protein